MEGVRKEIDYADGVFSFMLHHEKMTIRFAILTGWQISKDELTFPKALPVPMDIGCHSEKPVYPDMERTPCPFRESGRCYYDGSGLEAFRVFGILIKDGLEALWKELEETLSHYLTEQEGFECKQKLSPNPV